MKQLCVLASENFLSQPPSFYLPTNNSSQNIRCRSPRNQHAFSHNTCILVCSFCSSGSGLTVFPPLRLLTGDGMSAVTLKPATESEGAGILQNESVIFSKIATKKKSTKVRKTFLGDKCALTSWLHIIKRFWNLCRCHSKNYA